MRFALIVFCVLWVVSASAAALFLRGSGSAGVSIIDIQPHSASTNTNTMIGTTVTTFTCVMSDGSTCPPPGSGFVWTTPNQPSFLTLNQTTGAVTTNRALTPADACTPSQDSCTFAVTIGPPAAVASNCPTTPPAPAARAGYTTLAYCLDPTKPVYADVQNWVDCTWLDTHPTTTQKWFAGVNQWGTDCGKSETQAWFVQATDSQTGKTVLWSHWDALKDSNLGGGNYSYSLNTAGPYQGGLDFPAASYFQIRFRHSPTVMGSWQALCCTPNFFLWSSATYTSPTSTDNNPSGCTPAPPSPYSNYCYNGHIEVDVLESQQGNGVFDGIRECSMPGGCNYPGPGPGAPNGNDYAGFFSADNTGTVSGNVHDNEIWAANGLSGTPYQYQTTFGFQYTTDGISKRQGCWYFNDQLVVVPSDVAGIRCGQVDFAGTPAQGLANKPLNMRIDLFLWIAGSFALASNPCQASSACKAAGGAPNLDTYIEYIAVWSCPAWNNFNLGNGYDSQPPCTNTTPLPQ